ncbi:ZIP family metal transporter [Candidatus Woesearchaeota archaeon]|nr:ZIP family metal transporter [Candidatus Woesearchaeota archaeon]
MNQIFLYSLTSVFLVSLISLIGVFTISLNKSFVKKILFFFIAFSTGALLGNAFIHLIPKAINNGDVLTSSLFVLLGIIFFFILEKIICWRHCHLETSKDHPHPVGFMNLIGDIFHNFFDGLMIAGSFLVSIPLGFSTTLAVILHEIPQEIGDFSILIFAGFSKLKALFYNFVASLFAFLGVILVIVLDLKTLGYYLLPITAGGFIYIASSDLIPELNKEDNLNKIFIQLFGIIFGILIMLLLLKA